MKLAYAKPANDEIYLIGRNEARRIVRSLYPELKLLSFQTMHGPKMSDEVPYFATFNWQFIRILSVRQGFITDDLCDQFRSIVLPFLARTAKGIRWPRVVVAVSEHVYQIPCSEGWLFPSLSEVQSEIRKQPHSICTLQPIS